MRYKNWKIYFAMASEAATGGLMGVHTFHWPLVNNIRRDPFEGSVGFEPETLLARRRTCRTSDRLHLRLEHHSHSVRRCGCRNLKATGRILRCSLRRVLQPAQVLTEVKPTNGEDSRQRRLT